MRLSLAITISPKIMITGYSTKTITATSYITYCIKNVNQFDSRQHIGGLE